MEGARLLAGHVCYAAESSLALRAGPGSVGCGLRLGIGGGRGEGANHGQGWGAGAGAFERGLCT